MSKPPNLSDASDQDVVARAREGDEDAYREMLRRFGDAAGIEGRRSGRFRAASTWTPPRPRDIFAS
jgi:hypothetical protein